MISRRPGCAVSVASVAAILSGLWPKSSITVTLPAVPTVSSRRLSPAKRASAATASAERQAERVDRAERGERVHRIVAAGDGERDVVALARRRRA